MVSHDTDPEDPVPRKALAKAVKGPETSNRDLPGQCAPAFTLMPPASTSAPPVRESDLKDKGLLIQPVRPAGRTIKKARP